MFYEDVPGFLLVALVTHVLSEFLEFGPGFCIAGVDHEFLKAQKPSNRVQEALATVNVA